MYIYIYYISIYIIMLTHIGSQSVQLTRLSAIQPGQFDSIRYSIHFELTRNSLNKQSGRVLPRRSRQSPAAIYIYIYIYVY